jgi:PKD repeat protein
MKKKVIGIVVFLLIIGLIIPRIISTDTNQSVVAYDSNEEEGCGCETQQDISFDFTLLYRSSLDDPEGNFSKPEVTHALPPSFNWMDIDGVDWTTPAKDQGNCGSCWDFAAMGGLESIIQIREGCPNLSLDLSEQYILSCLHYAGSCNGGWAYNAYRYIKLNSSSGNYCNGIIPEFCFPYEVSDDIPCSNASSDWEEFLIPISSYGRWTPDGSTQDRDAMKTQIMDLGPIVATMLFTYSAHGPDNLEDWGYTHTSPTDYYPYPGPIQGTNHQVVLVGWNDDDAIPNGGYWIVKNSISGEWGYNGFFNIEYGSLNIDNTDINWVDYDPENFSNWPPVARINLSTQTQTSFDGSGSFDHEGTIVSYDWEFGDGASGTGVTTTHTYESPGVYQASLTVTDNASNTDTDTAWVFIDTENHAPRKPWLLGRRTGQNDTTYGYTFWATDPDGDDVYYYLNWGDTYWAGGAVGWIGPYKSGERITLEKNWSDKGNYTVRVKASDQFDAKSSWATLDVTMPVSYSSQVLRFFDYLFERFPHGFPFLRHLLGQ